MYNKIQQRNFLTLDTNPLNNLSREDSSLGELGGLRNQILLVLGIATLTTFVFIVAGTK